MSREDKLKELEGRNKTKIALTTDEAFGDVLQDKIDALKETIGKGVPLTGIDNLLEQLGLLQSFQLEVKHLKETIKAIDFPHEVSVEGLDALVKATEALADISVVGEKIVTLQTTFDSIHKSVVEDIYARYAWSNSAMGMAGQYIGYVSQTGGWFIQRVGSSPNGQTSLYTSGTDDYLKGWAGREKLKYQTRDKVDIA